VVIASTDNPTEQPRPAMPRSPLTELEGLKDRFGPGCAEPKLRLLQRLARTPLRRARDVMRLHETLCFLRAYPDDERIDALVTRLLARFERRADLRRFRAELAHTGIAGTVLWFPFFWPSAQWIANRWPARLRFDRSDTEAGDSLTRALPLLVTAAEATALRELRLPGYRAIDRLRGALTDATFLVRRVAAMPGDSFTREAFYDAINPSCELLPGRSGAGATPSRTLDHHARAPSALQREPLRRGRPDLRAEIDRPPQTLRTLSAAQGERMIDLARRAMATRQRDLDAFAYGNARDVWLVDDGDGLAFALIGVIPERRAPVAAIYGALTLRNGVPIGYVQADLVGHACALSFNTFDTFRGAESAHCFGRLLAALHTAFGAATFSIEPYQLGQGNDEALVSGAWWFYFNLGFRPHDTGVRRLARRELARRRRDPAHRSSPDTLRRLAVSHLHFARDPAHVAVVPPLAALGLRVAKHLARHGADREAALERCADLARRRCGLPPSTALSPAQRRVWQQWGALLVLAAGLPRWPRPQKRALIALVNAKALASEREYVLRLAAHTRLQRALFGASFARRDAGVRAAGR
jgi:hypothetical protein